LIFRKIYLTWIKFKKLCANTSYVKYPQLIVTVKQVWVGILVLTC